MYLYIYDSFLSDKKYASLLAAVERRVTDLGIQGKIARLSILKNIKELVTDAVKHGVSTVVAIGDDQTFTKMINIVADLDVTLGIVPTTGTSRIARVLGIPPWEFACDVVAARMIRRLDLGKINNYFFLNAVEVKDAQVFLENDNYQLAPTTVQNTVRLCNVGSQEAPGTSNPTDGVLEAVITPVRSSWFSKKSLQPTVLPFTKIRISAVGEDVSLLTDEQVILKTPAEVEIVPKKLRVIVGSQRAFE